MNMVLEEAPSNSRTLALALLMSTLLETENSEKETYTNLVGYRSVLLLPVGS